MWLNLIRISLRNVTRNTRRTVITALAVLIGSFFIIMARGLINGLQSQIVSAFTETQSGDVQLHTPEYLESIDSIPLSKSFELGDDFKALMGTVPEVTAYTGRIQFSGMISNSEDTTLFIGIAVDPENEYKVCPRNKRTILPGGRPVSNDESRGVVIGKGLADSLNAKVGTELTLLVTTRMGSLNGMDVTVVGIAEFKLPGIGNKVVHIPLSAAQHLLYMDGQVTEAILDVKDVDGVRKVAAELSTQLDGPFKSLNLVPNTWMDVGQLYVNTNDVQDQVLWIVLLVLFIIMIAGIVNTMLMSVFERVREIGTMMAVGVKRAKILVMFLIESAVLGGVGSLVGVTLGAVLVAILNRVGMPLPDMGDLENAVIYPHVPLWYFALVTGIALLAAILAALYPAWRAARMRPADALRTL